ncbi:MAG: hypothetical protein CVV25_08525 [Ignavibacteriae bacterium HGW-Ignavibacteriae-4]|nr:MAG: hypothetical protein CVV25_08525 [Ignavibacteriae bacterium HGW-Ignavibacteriae-4]
MKIQIKLILIPLFLIVITVFGYFILLNDDKVDPSTDEIKNVDYNKLDEILFDVKTSKVIRGDLVKSTNTNGLIRANKEIDVVSNISGYINEIKVFEGKKVNGGELLISLDDREFRIALKEAEDRLIEARVEYGFLAKDTAVDSTNIKNAAIIEKEISTLEENYKNGLMNESKYLSEKEELELKLIFTGAKREELILNKSGYSRAVNAKERAKLNLEYTLIKAPFQGVIGDLDMSVGQRVNPGEKLFKLLDISKLRIDVGVLESEITEIAKDNTAKITVTALPNQKYIGRVVFVSPYIDPINKTCKVTVEINNPDAKLKPGMFAQVNIETESLKNKILIPKDALLVRDRRNLVFVLEEKLARWKYVDIGEQNDLFIEILKGVVPGEDVIVEGQYTLAHDARVRVIGNSQ